MNCVSGTSSTATGQPPYRKLVVELNPALILRFELLQPRETSFLRKLMSAPRLPKALVLRASPQLDAHLEAFHVRQSVVRMHWLMKIPSGGATGPSRSGRKRCERSPHLPARASKVSDENHNRSVQKQVKNPPLMNDLLTVLAADRWLAGELSSPPPSASSILVIFFRKAI